MQRILSTCPTAALVWPLPPGGPERGHRSCLGRASHLAGTLCMRGWTSFQHLRRPERLEFPQIRLNGTVTRVPWEEALACLVDGLERVRLEHTGKPSVSGLRAPHQRGAAPPPAHRSRGLHTNAVRFDPCLHVWTASRPPSSRGPTPLAWRTSRRGSPGQSRSWPGRAPSSAASRLLKAWIKGRRLS